MSHSPPTLHLVCGKIAAGKSTLTAKLAQAPETVLLSEDEWLSTLFADEMASLSDYVRCAEKLRNVMGPHITALLAAGVSVVLDFPANTLANRSWMRGLALGTQAQVKLHFLDVPDAICLARLQSRNKQGDHPFAATKAQFEQVNRHFVPPSAEEGFEVVTYTSDLED